ncbi:MAG: 2Fe-2S iron-sulfur cluster-binding protein [Armatimonadota bacterium]
MADLTIDGQQVTVEEGATIVQAAKQLGIEVPTLCYNEAVPPYGSCRVCLVEITAGGRLGLTASCCHPAEDGLVVETDNSRVLAARRVAVELLLARCPNVPKIRELADELGIDEPRFASEDPTEECILCGLCVRACAAVVGRSIVNFVGRGADRSVTVPFEEPSEACIACGACALVCPTGCIKLRDEEKVLHRELSLAPPKSIYVPSAQAVPNVPVIDQQTCIHAQTGECKVCEKFCEPEAINFEAEDEVMEIEAGTMIVATGYDAFDPSGAPQYGYGRLPNVITGLEFEVLSNAGGPTAGEILLEDGRKPESVAIMHCVGSRDENNNEYCSRVCCMYSLKFAHLVREKTEAEVYELYIDMRAGGKGYEEFYDRVMSEDVIFIRGKGAEVTDLAQTPEEEGKLIVCCEDTLLGMVRRVPVDMVILSTGLQPRGDAQEMAQRFGLPCAHGGFYLEQHPKLAPVATNSDGIFIAGACQGPKDIPDSVAQGAAAAAEALALIDRGSVTIEPIVSFIDEDRCGACKTCIALCPYTAIEFDDEKSISVVQEALCKGCGTCVAACPAGAARQQSFEDSQIMAEIEGLLASA